MPKVNLINEFGLVYTNLVECICKCTSPVAHAVHGIKLITMTSSPVAHAVHGIKLITITKCTD